MNDAMYADFLKQHQKNTSEYAHLSTRKRMPTHTPIAGQTILDPQQVVRPQQHVQASLEILNLQKPLDDFLGPGLNEKDVNQPGPYQWRLYEPHLKLSPPLHPRRALESAQICPDLRMILIEYGAFKKWYSYNHILEICAGLSEPIPYQEVFCHLRRTIERFISLKNSLVSERSLPHHYPGTYETQATLKEQALLLQRHLKCS
jgi:hypothetical protein